MEREEVDQTKVAVEILLNVQQKNAESAATRAESLRLENRRRTIDLEVSKMLHDAINDGTIIPNKIYLIGTKGYIVRKHEIQRTRFDDKIYYNVFVEKVDIA